MCKYLQNAPKTLANRREAPSCMPWLIAIVVSLFVVTETVTRSFPFSLHTHTHTHQRRHTHASRLCSVIYAFRCIVVVAVVTVTTASVFSSYTHTLTRTVGFFYYYYAVISVVATLSATLLLPLCGSIRTAVYHCWGLTQKSYTTYVCMCVQMYMTDSIIFLCSSYRLTPNILLI